MRPEYYPLDVDSFTTAEFAEPEGKARGLLSIYS